jgi:hypothetical protein
VSDNGNTYALQVDADYVVMPERGWTSPAAHGTPIYPRGWTPRRVVGSDDAGHPRTAVVGSAAADLWTGAATTFTINGTDELPHTCRVFKKLQERLSRQP